MIQPISRSRVVTVAQSLPPAWLRIQDTSPDAPERFGISLMRVGPKCEFRSALTSLIQEARDVVLVASFLLADEKLAGTMLQATERGVRVYVLTASEAKLASLPREDDEFETRMIDEHKKLLDRLAGKVLLRSAQHFHAKFVVIDPTGESKGWVSTANFNKALEESVELGYALSKTAAREAAQWFSRAFWLEAEHELLSKGRLSKVSDPPALPPLPSSGSIVVTAKGINSLRNTVLSLIQGASSELWVSSYGFDADHTAVKAILEKARMGVRVKVFTRPRPAMAGAMRAFAETKVQIFAHEKLHAKGIISDVGALVMSANLQQHGLDKGFELGAVLTGREAQELKQIFEDWEQSFPLQYAAAAPRSSHVGEFLLADKRPREGLKKVIREQRIQLPAVVAESALSLDTAPEPPMPVPEPKDTFPQCIRFEWQVNPPVLPLKAKERFDEIEEETRDKDGRSRRVKRKVPLEPRVFDHEGKVFVLFERSDQRQIVEHQAAALQASVAVTK